MNAYMMKGQALLAGLRTQGLVSCQGSRYPGQNAFFMSTAIKASIARDSMLLALCPFPACPPHLLAKPELCSHQKLAWPPGLGKCFGEEGLFNLGLLQLSGQGVNFPVKEVKPTLVPRGSNSSTFSPIPRSRWCGGGLEQAPSPLALSTHTYPSSHN